MRGILSVADRTGLDSFARGLADLGVELFATEGTRDYLSDLGIPVRSVTDLTGFPEILGGRVKTLHPAIYAGILARRDSDEHMAQLQEHGIATIDLVAVNLYPFAEVAGSPTATLKDALENIDIGGPSLLRAAAKNFESVIVVVDPADYEKVSQKLRTEEEVDIATRRSLAAKAFQHTAFYDTQIAGYLRSEDELFPRELTIALEKIGMMRYGENPHQQAAFYAEPLLGNLRIGLAGAKQLHGIPMSFNNTLDADAAWTCVQAFTSVAVAIVKHGNPCGVACGTELLDTYRRALACDPVSAFGGAVGLNRIVDAVTAHDIADTFYEDIIAPGYTEEALQILEQKKNLRILYIELGVAEANRLMRLSGTRLDFKRVSGGFLAQTYDTQEVDQESLRVVTERRPTFDELTDLQFAWRAVKYVKSNAIVLAKRLATVGIGAGQMSRVDSVDIALRKAGSRAISSVLASDAFFPFPDGVEMAARAGITAIIQPGGSIRDEEIIRVANRHHMAMVFTGSRHFRH